MGLFSKRKSKSNPAVSSSAKARGATVVAEPPKLARRSANRKSSMKSGLTIGERREKLETASERTAARNKVKRRERRRIIFTVVGFAIVLVIVIVVAGYFISRSASDEPVTPSTVTTIVNSYAPTIEVVDEDTGAGASQLTSRMKEYIGQAESDFRELGYVPVKAVIPTGAIREVDFYLDGYSGFIKLVIDRGTGVSTEDADRMIRYLASQGIADFTYIDVRLPGKAYWK